MGNESEVDSTILEKFRSYATMRPHTDKQVSIAWLLVPIAQSIYFIAIIAYVAEIIFALVQCFLTLPPGSLPSQSSTCGSTSLATFFAAGTYFQVVSFGVGCAYGYVVFLLARRRNTHFFRASHLKKELIESLREVERARGVNVEANLIQAETIAREEDRDEGEKSAILFGFLVLLMGLPYVALVGFISLLYSFYFLQRDWRLHDEREYRFFQEIAQACDGLGLHFSQGRSKGIPGRSVALYVIGSIFTVGIFEIYWLYTLINDPNQHLKDHAQSEDNLLDGLGSAFAATPS